MALSGFIHYYGYSLDEALKLPSRTYMTMMKCMRINKARDLMDNMTATSYPNLKEEDAKNLHREIYKRAYPNDMEVKDVVKLGDLSKVLR